MAKQETIEFEAKLTDDSGVVRGRIPAPLVQLLGGRAGDFVVFRKEGNRFTLSLRRSTGASSTGKKTASSSRKRK